MVFRKRKERTDRLLNELHLGEFWLMPGAFRAEEATAGMMGSYGLPEDMGRWRPRPNRRKHCAPSIRLYSHCGRGQCRATCGADRVGLYRTYLCPVGGALSRTAPNGVGTVPLVQRRGGGQRGKAYISL